MWSAVQYMWKKSIHLLIIIRVEKEHKSYKRNTLDNITRGTELKSRKLLILKINVIEM